MSANKLKGKLRENQLTYEKCAEKLGITITALSNKLNGKSVFTVPEAVKLAEILGLTKTESIDIFFAL